MLDEVTIDSPEQVQFTMELAGPGSRFVAIFVDSMIQSALLAMVVLILVSTSVISWTTFSASTLQNSALRWVLALGIVVVFVITWGYHAFFETVWNGQTPGKRWTGLRVIREGGYPISFFEAMVRNLVRYVDFLPFFYGVGLTTMMLNRSFKRLGDFAAGTLVVKVRSVVPSALAPKKDGQVTEVSLGSLLTVESLVKLDKAHYVIIREFIRRREELDLASRSQLAERVCRLTCNQLGIGEVGSTWQEKEAFLLEVVSAYTRRK